MNAISAASDVPASGPQLDNRRVLAALIDLAIVAVAGAAILAAAGALGGSISEVGVPLTAVVLGWALYYYFACESADGQTVGKRVMKLRVVRTDGSPAGMREIALRTVLRIVDMQLVYLVGLIVMIATGERRGRLGDLVGDTMIVSVDEPAAAKPAVAEAVAAPRIPIAESGPAFEPVAGVAPEPEVAAEPAVADEPEVAPEPEVADEPEVDIASPSLKELASDVAAASGSEPDEDAEEETEAEPEVVEIEAPPSIEDAVAEALAEAEQAEVEAAEPPEAEEAEEVEEVEVAEPADDHEDEQAAEDDDLVVKSVDTVSAIDLVMDDSARDR
jgi:uncharacterized RDD family membrane protein YckC